MTTANSCINVAVLPSVLCLGLAMMFIGGWYFQSSQQETVKTVQQLKEKLKRQNKQLVELQLQLELVSL